ncbi:MAG TPA: S-methyl-5-thioribose-1-phosphate isomerase [Polyangiaceae bacterium]|jgi:methylthioribose-1-phosphate isomerase|nr:S-methyl-5-thioribose-1-phosphate isomerase [Polyangiaceae bacterium]
MNDDASRPLSRSSRVETLRFQGGKLELIDQRVLPKEFVYLAYSSAQEVAEAIRSMVVRGAPAIGCAAAYGVALEAIRLAGETPNARHEGLARAFAVLRESRPTAVNLFWALARMKALLDASLALPASALAERLLAEAHAISRDDVANNRKLGAHGAALLEDGMNVLTHCNAGALATAGHGTALGVIRSAVEAGKRIAMFADETRPFMQGARLTAWELAEDGIPVTLITDNMAGHFMSRGEIQAVIVGADRVAANGDVANKIGTYMVAVLARRHRIPFYVAAPLSTIDLETPNGAAIPIEERDSSEVASVAGVRFAPAGVNARHPAFDVTPAELVTALVTERGVVREPNREQIAALFPSDLR